MRGLSKKRLFRTHATQVPAKLRDQLIFDYIPVVRWEALEILRRLPKHIELDDLISSGIIGLIDAIEKFDPARGVNFRTYAKFRIRGEILDTLRAADPASRSMRENAKTLERVTADLQTKLGRAPTSVELAAALDMTIQQFHDFRLTATASGDIGIDTIQLASMPDSNGPYDFEQLPEVLAAIDELPEDLSRVLKLRYRDDLSLAEIAKLNGYSESRACQVHKRALNELKKIILRRPQMPPFRATLGGGDHEQSENDSIVRKPEHVP